MRRLFAGTLLVSAGALGYELLLMRLLSIVQWHHFAYMIISVALLGYGASGTFIALARRRLERNFEWAFALCALAASIAIPTGFALGQRIPFNALEIVWDLRQFGHLGLLYAVFFVPFFFAATCIGLAFTCRGTRAGTLYAFDLAGAGSGALLVLFLLHLPEPETALVPVAALPLAGSVLMVTQARRRRLLVALQAGWLALLAAGLPQQFLELRISPYKGLSQATAVTGARLIHETSSPLGHLAVVESPDVPFRHAPGLSFRARAIPPEQLAVFTDADAMSVITRFDGDLDELGYLADTTPALPYALLDSPEVLVLGAGGGNDVLLALYHGARRVDAVELDPAMLELVTDTFADFAGAVYAHPAVATHVAEAREFVAHSEARYDLVHIGLLDSFAAAGAGVQALNESYLYTVEALTAYLEHTKPGGLVAITRWLKIPPRDSLKLAGIAIEALRASGVRDPGTQLALVRSWNTATLIVKNGPFRRGEIQRIRQFAEARSFDTAWLPGIRAEDTNRYNLLEQPYFHAGVRALLGEDAADFIARYKFDIEPATDDRPYFFQFFRWRTLPEVLELREVGGAGLIELGYLVLAGTFVQAIVLGLLLVLVPLAGTRRDWPAGTGTRMGSYFLLLGLAFLFVEIAFIQKFLLFLGHPLYAVAVVLTGFLLFAGLGSAMAAPAARRLSAAGIAPIGFAAGLIGAVALGYVLVLPELFSMLAGLPGAAKILVTLFLIAPLAIPMGMPFPLGLARVHEAAPAFIPWAWGINGFASVVSAVLATLLAIEIGFSAVIVIAVACYALAAILLRSPAASPVHR